MRIAAAALLLTLLGPTAFAQLRAVQAVPLAAPVTIDGALDEPDWQAGDWNTGFSVLDMPGAAAPCETRFKVRVDEAFIYFGAEMDEPLPADIKAAETERDHDVWGDDCVEVMLGSNADRIEYYHLIVNSLGTVYDAQMRQGGHVRSVEWNCGVEAAATVGQDRWWAELRIPLVDLELNARSAGDWALNVTRARRTAKEELSSFAPLTGEFHQPSLYATLTLAGAKLGGYLWDIKPPYEVRVLADGSGAVSLRTKTHITNAGPGFRFIQTRARLGESAGPWVKDGLDKGQSREHELSVPVAGAGKQMLTLEIADRREPDIILARKTYQQDVTYTPISIVVNRPWYRNSIYATENLSAIEFDVALAVPEAQLKGASVTASLRPAAGGNALAQASAPAAPSLSMKLPAADLPEGAYLLQVALMPAGAPAPAHTAEQTIRKLPAVADEWRIDEQNVLRHNGEPFLPFGWFSMSVDKLSEPGHAYTAMQAYNSQYFSNEKVRAELDAVAAAGSVVTIYPYPSSRMLDADVCGRPLTDEEAEAIRLRIAALKDHPGVLAWYMADEPELRPELPERSRRIFETVRDEDPFHPCIMLNDTIAGIFKYVDGGDILMPDPYPCFIKGGLAAQPIEKTGEFMRACQEASKGRRAIWITPQGFNYGDYGKQNQRGPNLTELRNQLYQAVVYGAKGFLWYTHSQVSNYPDLDIGMRWLSFEVADLKPAILANPASDVSVTVTAPRPEHIHVSPRRVGEHLYIFAVNTATEPQDATLTITPPPGLRSLYVVSEGRTVPLNEGAAISDRFGLYETHIYTTDPQAGGRESISVPQAAIDAANAARKKPGNLAFEDSGAGVEVSSASTYGSEPDRVLDGIIGGMQWRDGTQSKLPDWLVVRWPQEQTIKRAVVYSTTIADAELQVPEGDDWRTIGTVTGAAEDSFEIALDAPVTTSAMRILVTKNRPEQTNTTLSEVEAYAQ